VKAPADLTSSEKLSPTVADQPDLSFQEWRRVVCVSSTVKLGERPVVVARVVPDVGEGRPDRSAHRRPRTQRGCPRRPRRARSRFLASDRPPPFKVSRFSLSLRG
jgi:hypothetical protein